MFFVYENKLPFVLIQKVVPKNQGGINPWLKIPVLLAGNQTRLLRQWFPSGQPASDFPDDGFMKAVLGLASMRLSIAYYLNVTLSSSKGEMGRQKHMLRQAQHDTINKYYPEFIEGWNL